MVKTLQLQRVKRSRIQIKIKHTSSSTSRTMYDLRNKGVSEFILCSVHRQVYSQLQNPLMFSKLWIPPLIYPFLKENAAILKVMMNSNIMIVNYPQLPKQFSST